MLFEVAHLRGRDVKQMANVEWLEVKNNQNAHLLGKGTGDGRTLHVVCQVGCH